MSQEALSAAFRKSPTKPAKFAGPGGMRARCSRTAPTRMIAIAHGSVTPRCTNRHECHAPHHHRVGSNAPTTPPMMAPAGTVRTSILTYT